MSAGRRGHWSIPLSSSNHPSTKELFCRIALGAASRVTQHLPLFVYRALKAFRWRSSWSQPARTVGLHSSETLDPMDQTSVPRLRSIRISMPSG